MFLGMSNSKFSQYLFMKYPFKPFKIPNIRSFSTNLNLMQCSQNPFMEKYAAKIAEVRKMTPEDFKHQINENLKHAETNNIYSSSKAVTEQINKKKTLSNFQKQNDLSHIMKLESVQEKTAQEIESIWKEYHSIKDGVYAVLPAKVFEKIFSNLKEYPVFLFPLPRAQGYEFIMCQFLEQSCYFTSLINYQAFKENAPISLTVTYFTEFEKEKGIVLMRGEYDSSLKAHEAQCLTNQLQLYYGGQDEEKNGLLWRFNKQPEAFKHIDLISNFERSLGNS